MPAPSTSFSSGTKTPQSISPKEQDEIFAQLATNARYELQQNIVNQVLDLMASKCYTRCLSTPTTTGAPSSAAPLSSSNTPPNKLILSTSDTECLNECGDKYLRSRQLVGEKFYELINEMKDSVK